MSKGLLIDHSPIHTPMVRVFARVYFKQLLFASLILSALLRVLNVCNYKQGILLLKKLSTALRVLQLQNKKLIQAKLHELLAQELGASDE
jgi:hypothetical protein